MHANFGYMDGSGEFYITVDTDKCHGCGDCVPACSAQIIALANNEFDPLGEGQIAIVKPVNRKSIKYDCAPCKPASGTRSLPCMNACQAGALSHSW